MQWFRNSNKEKYTNFVKKSSLKNIAFLMSKNNNSRQENSIRITIKKLKFGTKTRAIASVGEGTTLQSALRKSQCGLLTGTHRTVNA